MLNMFTSFTRRMRRFADDIRGVAAVEMAFIFPVMVLVYFGLVDGTNVLSANRRVTLTASTLADLVTQAPGTITTTDINDFFTASSAIMEPFDTTGISLEVYEFTSNGSGGVTLAWSHTNGGADCGGSAPTVDSQMQQLMAQGNDIVVSRVCYSYHWVIGKIFGSTPLTLHSQFALRPRQTTSIKCTDCV